MKESFYEYAMTTITNRALPDVRDGLKPVQRRIIYGMSQLKMFHNKPHKKSARIVGDILGKYHPHGDSSVYDAMVRLSQNFSLMIPLVDGHGNFGSIDGDSAAAMRYTEARLSLAGEQLSSDLEKSVVGFSPNYDDSETEPNVLPAHFPNLLINGSEGIATGMATNIPTHNPLEVIEAWRYMIQYDDKANEDTLLKKLSAPDYPYGGVIVNEEEVSEFYKTGYGRVTMRGRYHIEETTNKNKKIVFTELPRKSIGSKNNLVNQLIELVNNRTLSEVTNVVDESNREGIRLVISVKKNTDIDKFMNKLWLRTDLQSSDRMQFLVLVNGQPKTITLKEYFEEYISFQKELHVRKHQYLLEQVKDRLEVVDGLLEAHRVMDSLIDGIRNAKSNISLMNVLMYGDTSGVNWRLKKHEKVAKTFTFTRRQSEAILNRRLRSLTGLDIRELSKEQKQLKKEEKYHQAVITNKNNILKRELLKDVESFKVEYNWKRKTEVTTKTIDEAALEEKIAENIGIIVDKNGFVQTRESVSGTSLDLLLREDTDTTDTVAVFTSFGNLYYVKAEDIPSDKKIPIQVLSKMQPGEKINHITLGSKVCDHKYFVLTKFGRGKLLSGEELETKGYRSKTFYTKVDRNKGDEVILCTTITSKKWLIVRTNENRGGRIDLRDKRIPFRKYGKGAKGSILVKMKKNEYLTNVQFGDNLSSKINSKKLRDIVDVTGRTVRKL